MSARAQELLRAVVDAAYECGEWNGHDTDETYATVHARSVAADEALCAYIAQLEANAGRST